MSGLLTPLFKDDDTLLRDVHVPAESESNYWGVTVDGRLCRAVGDSDNAETSHNGDDGPACTHWQIYISKDSDGYEILFDQVAIWTQAFAIGYRLTPNGNRQYGIYTWDMKIPSPEKVEVYCEIPDTMSIRSLAVYNDTPNAMVLGCDTGSGHLYRFINNQAPVVVRWYEAKTPVDAMSVSVVPDQTGQPVRIVILTKEKYLTTYLIDDSDNLITTISATEPNTQNLVQLGLWGLWASTETVPGLTENGEVDLLFVKNQGIFPERVVGIQRFASSTQIKGWQTLYLDLNGKVFVKQVFVSTTLRLAPAKKQSIASFGIGNGSSVVWTDSSTDAFSVTVYVLAEEGNQLRVALEIQTQSDSYTLRPRQSAEMNQPTLYADPTAIAQPDVFQLVITEGTWKGRNFSGLLIHEKSGLVINCPDSHFQTSAPVNLAAAASNDASTIHFTSG